MAYHSDSPKAEHIGSDLEFGYLDEESKKISRTQKKIEKFLIGLFFIGFSLLLLCAIVLHFLQHYLFDDDKKNCGSDH